MERIRQRLLDESAGIKKGEEKRREREGKKFGKQVQIEKLKEREKSKKEMDERLKGLKRSTFHIHRSHLSCDSQLMPGIQNAKVHWTMYKQMMTVSTSLSRMRFQITLQNEEKVRVAAKSAAHPETRNSDLVEQGRDRSRMIGRQLTILNLDLARGGEEAFIAEGEAGDEVVDEGEEAEEARGLEKTNVYLRAVEPETSAVIFRLQLCASWCATITLGHVKSDPM
jgi:hypothetical protein